MSVRKAEPRDASGIGVVHVRSWQAIYRGHFPQDFLDGLDPEARAARWREYLRGSPQPRAQVLVAEQDKRIVGFANVGPSRDDETPELGELRAIYLLPECWERGLGRELMAAGRDALAKAGFAEAMLWVLGGNQRARRFYERDGWLPDGAVKQDEGLGFPICEVRYRRALPEGEDFPAAKEDTA